MSSDRPVELRELPRGTPSTFDMPGVREDLAPKKQAKRKRVAFKWEGAEKSENIEDRRNENYVSDESQRGLLSALVEYSGKKGKAPTPIAMPQEKAPFPLPRRKRK